MADRIGAALDALADTSLSPVEAVARFRRLSRGLTPASRAFAAATGVVLRREREAKAEGGGNG